MNSHKISILQNTVVVFSSKMGWWDCVSGGYILLNLI